MREQTARPLDKTILFKLVGRQRVMFQANGVADPFDTASRVRASLVEEFFGHEELTFFIWNV